ncbi:MAG TPA: NUDIX hydrolase [Intrasporangium sp.]|uniref:NUDIX hydrolase n=1 Tax=Intrasporangium sp. TaxID=1925024 RepID=UPI002D77A044|nr:NUDIX hydrolase [Intrasporangium sp.]HET7396917.1 NUDIX hydrolase [Intrasporangium sp.]
MSLTAPRGTGDDLVDVLGSKPVIHSHIPFRGKIFDVQRDTVDLGAGGVVVRDFVRHPGAVVAVAVHPFDGVDHVLLIRQYRHPAAAHLWELPAGLLDVHEEPPWKAAARELHEEVDLVARRWDVLIDSFASPGAFPEAVRIFLARELQDVPSHHAHARTGEEVDLRPLWVPIDQAHAAVLAGRLHNSSAIIGVLAAHAARARGWETVRPHDAPWPEHPANREPAPPSDRA